MKYYFSALLRTNALGEEKIWGYHKRKLDEKEFHIGYAVTIKADLSRIIFSPYRCTQLKHFSAI